MKQKTLVLLAAVLGFSPILFSQIQGDTKQRVRTAHELARQGEPAIAKLTPFVTDTDVNVRSEAVKSLVEIGGPKTVDLLVQAAHDSDPEIQIRATDGLVNVYLPGYIKTGISGTLQRVGGSVKVKFSDRNDQVIDVFVTVRPDVIDALGNLAIKGASLESRANACLALGILRGSAAIPQLGEALHSKDNQTIFEGLLALQKIRDPSSGSRVTFLVRDLDERVQSTAIETAGILLDHEAAPDLREVVGRARNVRIRRAAMSALAMLAEPVDHDLFNHALNDEDEGVRTAGAEGLGRLKNMDDRPAVQKAFAAEHKTQPRMAEEFALVELGDLETTELSPLRSLVNTLDQKLWQGVALGYLVELARDMTIRQALYPLLTGATKDEKLYLGTVLARSGEKDSVPYLQSLSTDVDPDLAQAGIHDLRALNSRIQ